jgi:hypothetical protein
VFVSDLDTLADWHSWLSIEMTRATRISVILLLVAVSVVNAECLGEYQLCSTGDCTLGASLCGRCKVPGQFLCPDGSTCVDSATEVQFCPVAIPLYNWTLPLAERVAGTLPHLTLEEKAAIVVMRSQVGIYC